MLDTIIYNIQMAAQATWMAHTDNYLSTFCLLHKSNPKGQHCQTAKQEHCRLSADGICRLSNASCTLATKPAVSLGQGWPIQDVTTNRCTSDGAVFNTRRDQPPINSPRAVTIPTHCHTKGHQPWGWVILWGLASVCCWSVSFCDLCEQPPPPSPKLNGPGQFTHWICGPGLVNGCGLITQWICGPGLVNGCCLHTESVDLVLWMDVV